MNRGRLSQFEQRIEQLIEGSFARLFAGRLQPREVATRLARAMDDNVQTDSDGTIIAPTMYNVLLNPEDYNVLTEAQPHLAASLADVVIDLAHRTGMRLSQSPRVELQPNDIVPPRTVMVEAFHHVVATRPTQLLEAVQIAHSEHPNPRNPQLIIQGTRYVTLDRPVINIGRRRDNHIVVDDPRMSRAHAQLRLRFGRYVLYDLGSSGGTYVNEHRVTETILKPGDVISMAGVKLVYIEDENTTGADKGTQTSLNLPLAPLQPDDPGNEDAPLQD